MLIRRYAGWVCCACYALTGAGSAIAQGTPTGAGPAYPNKVVRIITTEPGGNADFNARFIADGLTGALGQPVIVENRAGTIIAPETVAKAAPDGYMLLVIAGTFWISPLLRKTSYDPVRHFATISMLVRSPNVLVVHPSLPVKSVTELITLAKARPGQLNYASTGAGGSFHLAGELFKSMAGVNIVHIPYKGTAAGFTDLMTGQVQLSFTNPAAGMPHMKSGRLRALAVTSREPSRLLPGLPTIASAGLDGFEIETIFGLFAPAKTPEPVIRRLNQEVARVLNTPEAKERLFSAGVEAAPGAPDELAVYIRSDMSRMGKVIRDAGIRLD